jgi:hypothetical protein
MAIAIMAGALFAANVAINLPLAQNGAQPYRGSIESGYASIARIFAQNPNPLGWNPYTYSGLPTQFTYLPVVPYTTALLLWARPEMDALHAYRIVITLIACLGPVTLFLFGALVSGSRWWPFAAALLYSVCSPSYDLFETIDKDRGLLPIPWRLHVIVKYGEGPHVFGLTLLPLALLAVWNATHRGGFSRIFLAAASLAAVALTHWMAAFALALVCVLLMLTYAGAGKAEVFRHWRLIAAGALGYLLACFWLTPSFIETVAFNWPKDAFGFKMLEKQRVALALVAAGVVFVRLLFGWRTERRYLCFTTISFFLFAAFAESHYAHGVDPIPESRRYTLEMELFLVLAATEWLRLGWNLGGPVNRFIVCASLLLLSTGAIPQAKLYLSSGYSNWKLIPKEDTVEYKLAAWLERHKPQGRVFASGGLRFRLNSWFDIAQMSGTFDSGLQNRIPLDIDYSFRSLLGLRPGLEPEDSVAMLQAAGVEYLVVHGPQSREYYRDIKRPERFEGILQKAFEDGDDRVFRVPFKSLAHLIREQERVVTLSPTLLAPYLAAINDTARPTLLVVRDGANRIRINGGPLPAGALISLAESYNEGWRAADKGAPVSIRSDGLGHMILGPLETNHANVLIEFAGTKEQKAAAVVSGLSWILCLAILAPTARRKRKSDAAGNLPVR